MSNNESLGIAIIGLAGCFSGAKDLAAFWQLLKQGQEAVINFSDAELLAAGVAPELLNHPHYVKAGTVVPEVECFDADFFEISHRDAELTDPQHRLLMECAWQALEQAGYPPTTTNLCVSTYVGVGENTYRQHYLEPRIREILSDVGEYRLSILNSKDFTATRIAHKLNLTGAALTVQTACSTSLVAVHLACQSLLNFECDMALAGGASLNLPQGLGYLYQPGMILSPDGCCRAFDAQAQGTVLGGGAGIVLLKRLDDALADGDTIHAVILGSAINNDGSDKIGYTAPSVKGQTAVILEAQAAADVYPEQISYIEAHGTGTSLGDPIELEALNAAFQAYTQRRGYCAIGSVKTNIGHADTAAGIAGLIKTVLALKHRQLPSSLHFQTPNPQIDFENSPFFVCDRLQDWHIEQNSEYDRRCAGVSSFGIGGTNAHVIVAEAPAVEPSGCSRSVQLLTLSAKTATALETAQRNLANWLQNAQPSESPLSDVAYTLNRGRQSFSYRCFLVCTDRADALSQLENPEQLLSHQAAETARNVVFLFPGQGTQYLKMTQNLYNTEPAFRATIDYCANLLLPHLGEDLRQLLYSDTSEHQTQLKQTAFTQPVLFTVEYALAQLWMAWGIQPKAFLGHSIGEYVAACLAGVFSLEDALALVAVRGRLMQSLPAGSMLAVNLSQQQVQPLLTAEIALALVNGVNRCVLSGEHQAIANLQQKLETQGIDCRNLRTSHAFHSQAMEPILSTFSQKVQQVQRNAPTLPYLSNFTGTWITPEQAMAADYWTSHLRHTVRFRDNLQELLKQDIDVCLEVGPGHTLSSLLRQHPDYSDRITVVQSLPRQRNVENDAETKQMLSALGQLWLTGISVDWDGFYADRKRHRLPLPTYPFERKRYWCDLAEVPASAPPQQTDTSSESQNQQIVKDYLSPIEQKVAKIWFQCLGITDITPQTDFFDVGGDSLLATQLTARLGQELSISLDTHSLLQAPTLGKLAALIESKLTCETEDSKLPELVVKIQEGNPTRKPLILMHPVGGHVYFYRQLARHLDPELPIYGIRARGVEGEAEPLTTMNDMAKVYTAALQELQPHGPYYLGGSSFGGTLAFAMAQNLVAKGETVAFLALIDTPSPNNMPGDLDDTVDILFYLLKVGEDADIDRDWLRSLNEKQRLEFYLKHSKEGFSTPEELKTMLNLFRANLRAMREYIPSAYPGKIHFFLARDRDEFNAQTPAHGWINLAEEGIEIYSLPGNHITINTEPLVEHLANKLQQCLQVYNSQD